MTYLFNPKLSGSGIIGCIPQTGRCPNNCQDCFFQSGRSYLEPLDEHLPNMPPDDLAQGRIVRVNDGNDSNVWPHRVIDATARYPQKFYNTAIPSGLENFPGPVVLTVNPGQHTDGTPALLADVPANLMFVRFRANTWNLEYATEVVEHYAAKEIPVVMTWMAYFGESDSIPEDHRQNYVYRKRTLNSYWAITTEAWESAMSRWKYNRWVYNCGKTEGEKGTTACRHCGNCLREYFATMERLRK